MGDKGRQGSFGRKTLLRILLLLSLCSCEGQAFTLTEETTLPLNLIDYELLNAPSICVCRVICAANVTCTGVSARSNNGQIDCLFTNVNLQQSQLLNRSASNTWISTASQGVTSNDSLTPTVTTVVLASTTVQSSAVPSTTTTSATTLVTSATPSMSPSTPTTSVRAVVLNTTTAAGTTLPTSTVVSSSTAATTTSPSSTAATTTSSSTTASATTSPSTTAATTTSPSTTAATTSTSTTAADATPSTVPLTTTVTTTTVTTPTTTVVVLSTTASTTVTPATPSTTTGTTTTQPPQTTTTTPGVLCSAGQYPWINEVGRSCLQFSTTTNNYGGAYTDCISKGGAHFRPHNSQDMQNMIAFIKQLNTGKSYWARVYYYSGSSKLESYTGIYQDSLIWATGNLGGTISDSAIMNPTTDYKLTRVTGSENHYYICALPEATASG